MSHTHCTFCLELLVEGLAALPCGHVFHAECAHTWLVQQQTKGGSGSGTCSICKAPLRSSSEIRTFDFAPNHRAKRLMEKIERDQARKEAEEDALMAAAADQAAACSSATVAAGGDSIATAAAASSGGGRSSTSLVASHPVLFRLKLADMTSQLDDLTTRRDALQPRFQKIMERYCETKDALEASKASGAAIAAQATDLRTQANVSSELLLAKQTKLAALKRARTILAKHRVTWSVLAEAARREESYLASASAQATSAAPDSVLSSEEEFERMVDRSHEAQVAYTSQLLHLTCNTPFDVHAHPLLTSVAAENARSTRQHLALMHAAFVRRRVETLQAMRDDAARARLPQTEALEMNVRAIETQLRAQRVEHDRLKHALQRAGYALEQLKHQRASATADPKDLASAARPPPPVVLPPPPRKRKAATLDPKTAAQVRAARDALEAVEAARAAAIPSRPHASYRERHVDRLFATTTRSSPSPLPSNANARMVIDADAADEDEVFPLSSQAGGLSNRPHALLPTHKTLPPNHRALAEADDERSAEDLIANLWAEEPLAHDVWRRT